MSLVFRVHYMVTLPERPAQILSKLRGFEDLKIEASTRKGEPVVVSGINADDARRNAMPIIRTRHGADAKIVIGKIKRAGDTAFSRKGKRR